MLTVLVSSILRPPGVCHFGPWSRRINTCYLIGNGWLVKHCIRHREAFVSTCIAHLSDYLQWQDAQMTCSTPTNPLYVVSFLIDHGFSDSTFVVVCYDARNYRPGTNATTATILTFFLLAAFDIITTGICVVCPTSSALTSYNITGIIIFRAITLFREAGWWHVLRSSGIFSALVQQGKLRYRFVTRYVLTMLRRLNIFLVSRTNTL